MTYIATYKTKDGVELEEEINEYDLALALKEAREEAKRHGWTLISVKPKQYPPIPVVYPPHEQGPYHLPYEPFEPHWRLQPH